MDNYYEICNKINFYLRKVAWYGLDYSNIEDTIYRTFLAYHDKYQQIELDNKSIGTILKFSFNKMRNVYNEKARYYKNKCEYKNMYDNLLSDNKINILNYLILKERNKILLECVNRLNYQYRRIIILHFYYEYTFKEISIMLNIEYKVVLKYKDKALKILKIMLSDLDYCFN